MLEAVQYEANAFVTLTYSDPPLTLGGLQTLAPEDLRNFLKRLRNKIYPEKFRFYACGEYGDENYRPHYHAAMFNLPTCARGRTLRLPGSDAPKWGQCCAMCKLVGETWGLGNVDLGILEIDSAQYVAGYVTKKMTNRLDPRLKGREPEFARQSNRPGIGAGAMWEIADTWMRFNLDEKQGDVPVTLRHGSRQLPLGRYLRRTLRKYLGKEQNTPQHALDQIQEELRPVQEAAFNASESFAEALAKNNAPSVARFKARLAIFNNRKRDL